MTLTGGSELFVSICSERVLNKAKAELFAVVAGLRARRIQKKFSFAMVWLSFDDGVSAIKLLKQHDQCDLVLKRKRG